MTPVKTLATLFLWMIFILNLGTPGSTSFLPEVQDNQQLQVLSNTTIIPAHSADLYTVSSAKLDQTTNKIYLVLRKTEEAQGEGPQIHILKIDASSQTVEGNLSITDRSITSDGYSPPSIVLYNSTLAYIWLYYETANPYALLLGQIDLNAFKLTNLYNISGLAYAFKDSQVKILTSDTFGLFIQADQSLLTPVFHQKRGYQTNGLLKFSLFPQLEPVDLLLPIPGRNPEMSIYTIIGVTNSTSVYLQTDNDLLAFDVTVMQVKRPINFPSCFFIADVLNVPVPGTQDTVFLSAGPNIFPDSYTIVRWNPDSNTMMTYNNGDFPAKNWFLLPLTAASMNSLAYGSFDDSLTTSRLYRIGLDGFPNVEQPRYIEFNTGFRPKNIMVSPVEGFLFTTQVITETGAVFLLKIGS